MLFIVHPAESHTCFIVSLYTEVRGILVSALPNKLMYNLGQFLLLSLTNICKSWKILKSKGTSRLTPFLSESIKANSWEKSVLLKIISYKFGLYSYATDYVCVH